MGGEEKVTSDLRATAQDVTCFMKPRSHAHIGIVLRPGILLLDAAWKPAMPSKLCFSRHLDVCVATCPRVHDLRHATTEPIFQSRKSSWFQLARSAINTRQHGNCTSKGKIPAETSHAVVIYLGWHAPVLGTCTQARVTRVRCCRYGTRTCFGACTQVHVTSTLGCRCGVHAFIDSHVPATP